MAMVHILPDGGRGIGVNPRGTDYPFVAPSPDVRHLLADAYFTHYGTGVLPLSLSHLAGFGAAFVGATARCDVEIRDARGLLIFDSTDVEVSYRSVAFGTRFLIHEWYLGEVVCRIVQHTAFPDADSVVAIPDVIIPVDGRLDERALQPISPRVRSIRVRGNDAILAGELSFMAGYNTAIAVASAATGLRSVRQLTWSAEPGSGLGRYPGCADTETLVRTINKIGPDAAGDFRIEATGCYWARPPVALSGSEGIATPYTLALGNDCGPCCECDDFVRVQRGILRTWDRFMLIAGDAETIRDSFRTVVERWRQEKDCVDSKVVTISLVPAGSASADTMVTICNHTDSCLTDVTVQLDVSTDAPGGSGTTVPGTTMISALDHSMVPYTMGGTWPSYTAHFDAIQAADRGVLRTRFRVTNASNGTHLWVNATASTPTPLPGLRLPQTVEAVVTLRV
jgi:hypothetical protein